MWLHKDLGWWAFVISVVALVLVYPLEVLAHITAPWWKNWWAERSIASTRKRIDKLEKLLADNEQRYKVLSEGEDYILNGLAGLGLLATFCVELLVVVLLAITSFATPTVSSHDKAPVVAAALFAAAFAYLVGYATFLKLSVFRRNRSPRIRNAMRKNIEELKQRLAKRPA
jgi:hypothetical protein